MADRRTPLRTCVGCREVAPDTELDRFVLVNGALRHDPSKTGAGRGAWLHPHRGCVERARKRHGFARSFHREVDDAVLADFVTALQEE